MKNKATQPKPPTSTPSQPRAYSVTEYAKKLNITTQAVRWQCANSKLPPGTTGQKIGSAWIITTQEP